MSLFCDKFSVFCVIVVLIQFLKVFITNLYTYVIAPYWNIQTHFRYCGKWAVITGATDGLGKAYAEALAERNMHIILISRTMEKLKKVAEEIEQRYNVETRIIQADFTNTKDTYEKIAKDLDGYEIGVLVNNVGMSYSYPEYFLNLETEEYEKIITCNIFSVTNMCKIVLPGMIGRNRGVIINISSFASQFPSPLLTVYSATKAYIDKFTNDLATEYRNKGIVFQTVNPGFVATNMSKIKRATYMAPTPEVYVKHALNTVGVREKTFGYYPHHLMAIVLQTMQYMCDKFARNHVLKVTQKLREKSLKNLHKSS